MAHQDQIRQAPGISAREKQDELKKTTEDRKARRALAASSPPLPLPPSSVLDNVIANKQLEVEYNGDEDLTSTCQEALTKEVENLNAGQGNNLVYTNQKGRGLMGKLSRMVCDVQSLQDIVRGH